MATAVATAPGVATLSPKLGGAVLTVVIGGAHIITAPINPIAVVGSAVVGTSTVG